MIIKIIVYLIFTVSGLTLFKLGASSNSINISNFDIKISITSLIGIICYGFSFLLWLNIMKYNKITFIFPIANGLVTVLTVISGITILNEKITLLQACGILCIVIGVFIVNINR